MDKTAPPHVRPAHPNDANAITTIWHTGWRDAHLGNGPADLAAARTKPSFATRATTRTTGADHATTLVAEVNGTVAGFVMVVDDEVEQVYVDSRFRGRGVAAPLLEATENAIREAGHRTAWLAVVAGNTTARRFYHHHGWSDDGPFDHHAPGGFIVPCHRYTKSL